MTREEAIEILEEVKALDDSMYQYNPKYLEALNMAIKALEQKDKCKWIHYDYRTICPSEHDVDNPYWRIPENRMDTLKYCPYCGNEIELEPESEDQE